MTKLKVGIFGVPVVAQWSTNPTRNHEVEGSIPGLIQCVKDPVLLWLWRKLMATALIGLLAWEPPYAAGVALKRKKINKNLKKRLTYLLLFIKALWKLPIIYCLNTVFM